MRYGLAIGALGLGFLALAWQFGGWAWLLAWPAAVQGVVAAAYLSDRPGVFGKRADGRLRVLPCLLLAPFLLFTWGIWHLQRLLGREDRSNEVVPGLWLGRRPYLHELPPGTALVVDMTAEFPVARAIRASVPFACVPTLDGTPPASELRTALDRIEATEGPVYVHCAAGHGRSAALMALVLVRRGLAQDVHEAQALMRRARPAVRMVRAQRERVTEVLAGGLA